MNIIKSFLTYGFLGWTMENLKNRESNFLSCNPVFKYYLSENICLLPFPPAYGLGGVFILFLYKKYPNISWITRIILFAVILNLMEFAGGFFGEKYVCDEINTCQNKNKMWDYKSTPNINGYIDVEHTMYWIILGIFGYLAYPFLEKQSNINLVLVGIVIWVVISYWKYP